MDKKLLAKRIQKFLDKFGRKTPDGDWNSPDAYELERCITELIDTPGGITIFPFSEWGSGGYWPYISKEGKREHEAILAEIKKLMSKS
jgi:hypothetical protein